MSKPLPFTSASAVALALSERLARILPANGFATATGTRIMRGKRTVPADSQVPCIIMIEGGDEPTDRPGRIPMCHIKLPFVIDAFDACDPENPNDRAHQMISDIKRAIFHDGTNLGGQAYLVTYTGSDIGPRPDGAAFVQARVSVSIEYVEDLTNP